MYDSALLHLTERVKALELAAAELEMLAERVKAFEDQLLNINTAIDELHGLLGDTTLTSKLAKELAIYVAKMEGMPAATFENYRV